jgi:tRNA modification GTPase
LNPAPAAIEKLGIAKTLECAAEADLFLLVFDATQSAPPVPAELAVYMRDKNTLAILNKMDLVAAAPAANVPATLPVRRVSALTGAGIDELVADIVRCADLLQQDMGEDLVVINARHAHALTRVQICLRAAGEKLLERGPVELLAGDLRGALDAFGDVAGKIDNERMLDQLFATFCIGK